MNCTQKMREEKHPSLKGASVLIVGMGLSGRAAAEFLLAQGADVWGIDQHSHLLETDPKIAFLRTQGAHICLESELIDFSKYSLIVMSPGIPQTHFIYQMASKNKIEIIGEIELACRFTTQTLIGITGTNGKTTVTSLISHILNQSGLPAQALGNIGEPFTAQLLKQSGDMIGIVELSSFQLETLRTPVFDFGVILNITPDHLDRYPDMQSYAQAKIHLKNCLKRQGKLYVEEKCYRDNKALFEECSPLLYGYAATNSLYYDGKCFIHPHALAWELPLIYHHKKNHEVENMMAAYGICKELGVSAELFGKGLATFRKPAHRIEFVDQIKGVSYFDDSKGTNIDAVIRAVEALSGKIVLIAGGVDKGASYAPWIEAFKGKVKSIGLIGEASQKIKKELGNDFPLFMHQTLEAAVKWAADEAALGENVLLSPGCSSFDMFENYVHRGEEFKRLVKQLS